MGYKIFDFECLDCGEVFEELFQEGETVYCSKCKSERVEKVIPTTRINTMNLLTPEAYKEKMQKRSSDHTAKMLKRDGYKGQGVINTRK